MTVQKQAMQSASPPGRPSTPSAGKSPGPHPCWPLWAGPSFLFPPLAVSPCIHLCDTLGWFYPLANAQIRQPAAHLPTWRLPPLSDKDQGGEP